MCQNTDMSSLSSPVTEPPVNMEDIKDRMDQAFELKRAHFLVGHTSKVQGHVDPVLFDMVVDNTDDGYDKQHGTFTTPFSGVYHFSLSGLPCLGTADIVWAIHVDQREVDRCVGGTAALCTFKRWLQEGTSITVSQITGCTTAMTFSGGSFETNYYDSLFDWY